MKHGRLLQCDRKLEAVDYRLDALETAVGRLCSNHAAGYLASHVSDVDCKVQKARRPPLPTSSGSTTSTTRLHWAPDIFCDVRLLVTLER